MDEPLDEYFTQARPEVCDLVVGSGLRVLDIGCAGGYLGAELKRRGTAGEVDGIEGSEAAAAEARTRLDRVWCTDLDSDSLDFLDGAYDAVVLADVLEHLVRPEKLLERIRRTMVDDAQLIVSVPNVRFIRVLLPLALRGRFEYADSGVLDRTHVRFFTRSSIVGLLGRSGYVVDSVARAPMVWRTGWKKLVANALGDLATEQFLIRAHPAGD